MAEQELDSLLIKIDSELGELKGIDSAISALQRLNTFTSSASGNIKQLKELGGAMKSFNNVKGLNDTVKGVNGMISAFERLTKVSKDASQAISQLGDMGRTLNTAFNGVGKNLEGLDKASRGLNTLVTVLERVTRMTGDVNGAVQRIGNLGRELQSYNNINLTHVINNVVIPIERIVRAFNALDKIEWRRTRTSFKDFRDMLDHDKHNLNLGDMFDIRRPVDQMQASLKTAEKQLQAYEKKARDWGDQVRKLESQFKIDSLVNRIDYRNAVSKSEMAQAYADAYRQGIPQLRQAIESTNVRAISDAWRNTQRAIIHENINFNLADLVNTDLPLDQMKANLRRMQNELLRAQSDMTKAMANIQRLRAVENNESNLRANSGYRSSVYTFSTARHHVEAYTKAIQQLQEVVNNTQIMPQTDAQAYKMLSQAEADLRRYSDVLDKLLAEDDQSASGQRNIETYVRGVDMLETKIAKINQQLGDMGETEEGLVEQMRRIAEEADRVARATAEANQNLRNQVGDGFGKFGSMLSGSNSGILKAFGNLSSMFGSAARSGLGKFDTSQLERLAGLSGKLGTVATALGQIGAVVGVVRAAFKAWWDITDRMISALNKFIQGCTQFARDMLSKVVGAFNAVAGAVNKAVSAVRSGAQMIVSALRKIGEVGEGIKSVFASVGRGISVFGKGAKAIASLVTPKTVKNLVSANKSIKDIIKNSKLLSTAIQSVTKWFTMLTRMLMRKVVQQFIEGMKQAFDDLVLFEKNANDGMMNLNTNVSKIFSALRRAANQWIAAFEPLINAVTPVVLNFLNNVQAFGENVAKFMAILTGQPYYIRAKQFYEDYGEQVDKTAKKVKNLTNGLDELNILNDSSDSDDGGITPEDMFEKVPVDGEFLIPTLEELLEKFKDWLRNIDWDWIKELLREWARKLADILNTIFRDLELARLLGETLAEIVNSLFEFLNELVHDLDWAAIGRWIAEAIKGALETIDWALIRDTVVTFAKGVATLLNEIFADHQLWVDIGSTVAHVINDVIVAYLDNFSWTFNFKNFADAIATAIKTALEGIDWEQIRHAIDGWTKGIVDVINTWAHDPQLWADIGNTIKHIINDIFINAFADLSEIDFAALTERIKEAIMLALDIDWDEFRRGVQNWAQNIADIINGFFADETFLTKITTSIGKFIDAIIDGLASLIEKIKGYDIGHAIATAIQEGLKEIDWDTVFTLPADLINLLSDIVRGIIDALPDGLTIANWLTEHLIAGITAIDWEKIKQNLLDLATKLKEFIEGILKNDEFWKLAGETTGNIIQIGIDFLFELVNINGEDLGTAIYNYINGLISKFDIGKVLSKTVEVAINIITAIDVALTGIDWGTLGDQITQGIVDAVNKLYSNRNLIKKTIEDAFSVFNNLVHTVLVGMINDKSFYKLGQIIGKVIMGIINGVWEFFDLNTDLILQGITQLANSLGDFLRMHHDEIVEKLNGIIQSLVDIIDTFFDEKSGFMKELLSIIEELDLDTLIGSIVRTALIKLKAQLHLRETIWNAVVDSGILDEIWDALVGLGQDILDWLWEKAQDFFTTPPELFFDILRSLFGFDENGQLTIDLSKIWDGIKVVFSGISKAASALAGILKSPLTLIIDEAKKLLGIDGSLLDLLFGKKDKKVDVPVTIKPTVDDSDVKPITIEDTEYGTITAKYITVSTLKVTKLDVKEIYAETLYVTDIFADVLHLKKVEVDSNTGVYEPEKFFADPPTPNTGVLSRDNEINASKITTPILEADAIETPKLTAEEIETLKLIAKEIESNLLNVKKIVSDLLKVTNIEAKKLTVPTIDAEKLNVDTIKAEILNVGDIYAKKLHVDILDGGTITGTVTGTNTGTGTSPHTGSDVKGSNDSAYIDPRVYDPSIKRWSDRVDVPSAREYLDMDGYSYDGTNISKTGDYTGTTSGTNTGISDGTRSDLSGDLGSKLDGIFGKLNEIGESAKGIFDSTKSGGTGKGGTEDTLSSGRTSTTGQDLLNWLNEHFGDNKKDNNKGVRDSTTGQDIADVLDKYFGDKTKTGVHKSDWFGAENETDAETSAISNSDIGIVTDQDVKDINSRLDSIYKDVKDFLDKVKKLFKGWSFADLFLPTKEKNTIKTRLDDIKKDVGSFLDGIKGDIEDMIDDLKEMFKNFGDEAFEGLKEKAEEEFSQIADIIKKYGDQIKAEYDKINAAGKTLFDGVVDAAEKELASLEESVKTHLSTIENEFNSFSEKVQNGLGNITISFNDALSNLPAITEAKMAEVYDIIDIWLERIYELLESFFTPDLFKGMTDGLKKALDEALKYIEQWCNDVKKKLEDIFGNLNKLLNGEVKVINVNINENNDKHLDLNTQAKSQNTKAVEALTDAIKSLQNSLGNIQCNCICSCCGNCGGCAIGGGGKNDPTDKPTGGTSGGNDPTDKPTGGTKGGDTPSDKPTGGGTDGGNNPSDKPTGGGSDSGNDDKPTGGRTEGGKGGGNPNIPFDDDTKGGGSDGGGTSPTDDPTGGSGGGSGTTPTNDPTGGSDGGTPTSPTGGGSGDKPDKPTDNDKGTNDCPNVGFNYPSGFVPVYALIGGMKIKLNECLPEGIKNLIASGKVPLVYGDGTPLSNKDKNAMLGYLKKKGWLVDSNNGKGTPTGGTGKQTGGTGTSTGGSDDVLKLNGDEVFAGRSPSWRIDDKTPQEIRDKIKNGDIPLTNKMGEYLKPEQVQRIKDYLDSIGWFDGGNTSGSPSGGSPSGGSSSDGLSNEDYVKGLYRDILGREGEENGVKGWTSALDSGALSREDVLNGFLNSPELRDRLNNGGFVGGDDGTGGGSDYSGDGTPTTDRDYDTDGSGGYGTNGTGVGSDDYGTDGGSDSGGYGTNGTGVGSDDYGTDGGSWSDDYGTGGSGTGGGSGSGGKCDKCELKDKAKRYGIDTWDENGDFIGYDRLKELVDEYERRKKGDKEDTPKGDPPKEEKKPDVPDIKDGVDKDGNRWELYPDGSYHPLFCIIDGKKIRLNDNLPDDVKEMILSGMFPFSNDEGLLPNVDQVGVLKWLKVKWGNKNNASNATNTGMLPEAKSSAPTDTGTNTNVTGNTGTSSGKTATISPEIQKALNGFEQVFAIHDDGSATQIMKSMWEQREGILKDTYNQQVQQAVENAGKPVQHFQVGSAVAKGSDAQAAYNYWYNGRFKSYGYKMGGVPNAGEIFVARENGSPEFVGSFGSKTAVANNDQIVTAVANGVSMAQDRVVSAIESQTNAIENAIDRKDIDVSIGDRQIAEANRRGEKELGQNYQN